MYVAEKGKSVAQYVAATKECLVVNDLQHNKRYPDGTGWNEILTTCVICVPIISLNEKCCAVIELRRTNAVDYTKVFIYGSMLSAKNATHYVFYAMMICFLDRSGQSHSYKRVDGLIN